MQLGVPTLRLLLACVLALLTGATAWALIETQTLRSTRQERDALKTAVNSRMLTRADARRRECAQDAEQAFHKLGYSENPNHPGPKTEAFTDHYSIKYDRCLIELFLTDAQDGRETDMRELFEVNERQQFGEYYWISSDTKKYWEQTPIQCRMMRPGKDEAICRSTAEWEAYEREMMNS